MKNVQQAIFQQDIEALQKLLPGSSSNLSKKYDFTEDEENVLYLEPLQAALIFNFAQSAQYLKSAGGRLGSSFVVKNYRADLATPDMRRFLATCKFDVSGQAPQIKYNFSVPGMVKEWLLHDLNLIRKRDFIETAVTYCNGEDLAFMINLGISLPNNLDELFKKCLKKQDAKLNEYWQEKLLVLATAKKPLKNLDYLDADLHAKMLHAIINDTQIDPTIYLSADINWFYQVPAITRIVCTDENSNTPTQNQVVQYQLLLDFFIGRHPGLINKIPLTASEISTVDLQGLSFLHKAVNGRYNAVTDPNQQLFVIKQLEKIGINPLLRTPLPENLTAYQLALQTNQHLVAQELARYNDEYIKSHPNLNETAQSQAVELQQRMEALDQRNEQQPIIDGMLVLHDKLKQLEEKIEQRFSDIQNKVVRLETLVSTLQSKPVAEAQGHDQSKTSTENLKL